jgi:hypothetical protein
MGQVPQGMVVVVCPGDHQQPLDNLRWKDSLRGAETTEIPVRQGYHAASHFEGSAFTRYKLLEIERM